MKEIITPLTGGRLELQYWLDQNWKPLGMPVLTTRGALLWVLVAPIA